MSPLKVSVAVLAHPVLIAFAPDSPNPQLYPLADFCLEYVLLFLADWLPILYLVSFTWSNIFQVRKDDQWHRAIRMNVGIRRNWGDARGPDSRLKISSPGHLPGLFGTYPTDFVQNKIRAFLRGNEKVISLESDTVV